MKSAKRYTIVTCVFLVILTGNSCKKFSVLNTNPNNPTPDLSTPDYLMSGVLSQTATWYGNLGSGNMSGAMQHTYQDAFGNTFSEYQWDLQDWTTNYSILVNNKELISKAASYKWSFHQGVGLIMQAFNFGNIADFWGDAPDSTALNGAEGGTINQHPTFDSQEQIYTKVISDLKSAINFLQGDASAHPEITSTTVSSDLFYAGDPAKWRKLAYSLLLRYYMRLSSKWNVQSNVEGIVSNVFESTDDDWMLSFPGTDANSSYQFCEQFASGSPKSSQFQRNKMCGTMTMKLKALKDPRIVIMAQPVETPSVVDGSKFSPGDNTTLTTMIGNTRYINPAAATAQNYKQFDPATYTTDRPYGALASNIATLYDTASMYVGIPISYAGYNDIAYNLNPNPSQQTSINSFVSYLRRDIYDNPNGPLLAQRMASYAEICFDLAEAAQKGWNVGSASDWYYKGIQASFDTWQVFSSYQSDVDNYYGCVKNYSDYVAQPLVAYDGTLQRIIEQKWIAAWQACNEAYMDWRRTGYPTLTIGWASYRGAIPVRFPYGNQELQSNTTNAATSISNLQPSAYIGPDGNNSAWSKFWLLQGTNQPW